MANLFSTAASFMGAAGKTVAGRPGTYKRGTSESDSITGVVTDMRQEVANEEGFGTGVFVTGWQFVASELLINGDVVDPRAGDIWEETLNGVDLAWEAMPPGPNQKVFEWRDTSRVLVVVWMKQVKR